MCLFPSYIRAAAQGMDRDKSRQTAVSRLRQIVRVIQDDFLTSMKENVQSAVKGELTLAYLARYSRLCRLVNTLEKVVAMDTELLSKLKGLPESVQQGTDVKNGCIKLEVVLNESSRMLQEVWQTDGLAKTTKPQPKNDDPFQDVFQYPKGVHHDNGGFIADQENIKEDKHLSPHELQKQSLVSDNDLDTMICALHDCVDEILSATKKFCEKLHDSSGVQFPYETSTRIDELRMVLPQKIYPLTVKDKKEVWITCSQYD